MILDLNSPEGQGTLAGTIVGGVLFLGLLARFGIKKMPNNVKIIALICAVGCVVSGLLLGGIIPLPPKNITMPTSGAEDIVFDLTHPSLGTSMGKIRCTKKACPTSSIAYPSATEYITLLKNQGVYDQMPQELKDKFGQCTGYKLCFSSELLNN